MKKKKKAKKPNHRKPRILNPHRYLLAKIARIRERVPAVTPTGESINPDTQEVEFRYTEAQYVFEVYRAECERENLIIRPYLAPGIQPIVAVIGRGVLVIGPFCIEDLETGYTLVGWGAGMGANEDWSANTAHTRALKQFLLTTFQTTWRDPELLKDVLGIAGFSEEIRQKMLEEVGKLLKHPSQTKKETKDVKRTRNKR